MAADTPRSKSQFVPLGSLIDQILASQRKRPAGKLTLIWDAWRPAVGDIIAENACPSAIKGSVLLVHVNSSAWLQQLRFLKKDLIAKINRALNEEAVKDITFKVGSF